MQHSILSRPHLSQWHRPHYRRIVMALLLSCALLAFSRQQARAATDCATVAEIPNTLIAAQGNAESGASYELVDRPGNDRIQHYVYVIKNVDQEGVEHLRAQVEIDAEVEAEGYRLFVPAIAAP